MDAKQVVPPLAITLVFYYSTNLFLQFFKTHYAWTVFMDPQQFKICIGLATVTQFSLLIASVVGVAGAPGLFLFKRWGRQLSYAALALNIFAFLFKSAARFWPDLICNYVNENTAPYLQAKEAFIYDGILFYPSPMATIITFLITAALLYFLTRRSWVKLFTA